MNKRNSSPNIYKTINKTNSRPKQLYQLKIKLRDISPPIWRRVLVSNHIYFTDLHDIIQMYFSWQGYHLHEFYFQHPYISNVKLYIEGIIEGGVASEIEDYYHFKADDLRLCDIFSSSQRRVYYVYDFGDNWVHLILLEKIFPYKEMSDKAICVGGKRTAPPEDCGGPWGYQEFVDIVQNPNHPEYKEMIEWIGGEFDPLEVTEIDTKMSPRKIEEKFGPSLEEVNK